MDAVRLRRANRRLVQSLGEELADLYVASRETSSREPNRRAGRRRFLNRLASDIRRPGFATVIAQTDHLVGCAFGFPMRGEGFWWPGFDGALPRSIEQLTRSGSVFASIDTLVGRHPRDQGVARRLQERLLTDHRASLGATLGDRTDRLTLTALHSWGWRDAGVAWKPFSATVLRVLVLPVNRASRTAHRAYGPAPPAPDST